MIVLIYAISIVYRGFDYYSDLKKQVNIFEKDTQIDINGFFTPLGFCIDQKCKKIDHLFMEKDENNIFYTNYTKYKSNISNDSQVYYPINQAFISFAYYKQYQTTANEESKKIFLANSDWFVNNLDQNNCWSTDLQIKNGPRGRWCSALAQGLGLSILSRAYSITDDNKYIETMNKAIKAFYKDSNSSICQQTKYGYFFEEYPKKSNSIHVLNGYMFSLIGLMEYNKIAKSKETERLLDEMLTTLDNIVSQYDFNGVWSFYSLDKVSNISNHFRLAAPNYHKLHMILSKKISKEYPSLKNLKKVSKSFEESFTDGYFGYFLSMVYVLYKDYVWLGKLHE